MADQATSEEKDELNKSELDKTELEKVELEKVELEKVELEKEANESEVEAKTIESSPRAFIVGYWFRIFSSLSSYLKFCCHHHNS